MHKDIIELIRFALDRSAQEPIKRRIAIYHGIGFICGDEAESRRLHELANDLSAAEERFAEFIFNFSEKTASETQNYSTANPPPPAKAAAATAGIRKT